MRLIESVDFIGAGLRFLTAPEFAEYRKGLGGLIGVAFSTQFGVRLVDNVNRYFRNRGSVSDPDSGGQVTYRQIASNALTQNLQLNTRNEQLTLENDALRTENVYLKGVFERLRLSDPGPPPIPPPDPTDKTGSHGGQP